MAKSSKKSKSFDSGRPQANHVAKRISKMLDLPSDPTAPTAKAKRKREELRRKRMKKAGVNIAPTLRGENQRKLDRELKERTAALVARGVDPDDAEQLAMMKIFPKYYVSIQSPAHVRARVLKENFLHLLAQWGTVGKALQKMKGVISRKDVNEWIEEDREFREALALAEEEVTDDLEFEAIQRAKEGSDTLLMFLLKANRRKFKETIRNELTGKDGGPIQTTDPKALLKAKLEAVLLNRSEQDKAQKLLTGRTISEGGEEEGVSGKEAEDGGTDGGRGRTEKEG